MPSTRIRNNEELKKLPDYCLIYFEIDGSTVAKRTDQVRWKVRGETCYVNSNGKDFAGKILAMKGNLFTKMGIDRENNLLLSF